MKRLIDYLNPISHLGNRKYSLIFPIIANILLCIASELYVYVFAKDPNSVGVYIIFFNVAFIIYFAFREGVAGGIISSIISIIYYLYIVISRGYQGQQLTTGIETIITLGILYFIVGGLIGWLKQHIDKLIERESDAKRRLETIIEQLPMGIIITDSKGRLVQRNKSLDEILGIKIPIGFKVGQDTLDHNKINGKDIVPSESPLANSLIAGKPITKTFTFQKKSGKQIYIEVDSAPIKRSGEIIAAVSIVKDITEQKEQVNKRDDFLSMAAHELKTPITSLKMFLNLSDNEIVNKNLESVKYYNSRILDQVDRLTELTTDLLDVTRIQTGKMILNKTDFLINDIIKSTIEDLQPTTKKNRIVFDTNKRINIHADKYRIYQVLVNLITNAIKYSPKETKIIINMERSKSRLTVSVKDFGIGIDKNSQKKIFDKLYQVNLTTEKTYPGLGLGLYISKEIVKRHNGKMWVNSAKGKGTTFYFSLPIK